MISGAVLLVLVLVLLLLEGFFSGSEIAIISANKPLLKKRAGEKSLVSRILDQFQAQPQHLLGTHIIGTTLCVVASSTLATFYFRERYGEIGELYTLLIMSPLLLILGEMVPKMAFQEYAQRLASKSLLGLWFFSWVFYPLVWFLGLLAEGASRLLGGGKGEAEPFFSRSELKFLLTGSRSRLIPSQEEKMIRRVFRFTETRVGQVMIPLVEVKALDENSTLAQALEFASRYPFSRYPVYQERIDNIIGMVESRDLLSASPSSKLKELVKPVKYVPETMPVDELLQMMQKENFIFAVVVDEYGGCVGIITREDILEEVIGEIEDEHEQKRPLWRKLAPGRWLINARMEIDQLNELFGWSLPKNGYETLAGFLLDQFQRIPRTGEILRWKDFTFLVRKAEPRSILEVIVLKEEEPEQK